MPEDMLKAKNDFDRTIEMADYFSAHSYSDEQKELISQMFLNNEPRSFIDVIDESFSVHDIQAYNELLQSFESTSDVTDFLNNHRMLAYLPLEDRYADEIEEMKHIFHRMSVFLNQLHREITMNIFMLSMQNLQNIFL